MTGVWTRPRGEYQRGVGRFELCSMKEARRERRLQKRGSEDPRSIEEKGFFSTGVRATEYYPHMFESENSRGWHWFELVPEPSNPYDPNAVAVDRDGSRIGYLSSRIARVYHWRLRVLNGEGYSCFSPGHTSSEGDCWIVLPAASRVEHGLVVDGARRRLSAVWSGLPEGIRARIEANGYHINSELAKELLHLRDMDPYLFPTQPDPHGFSQLWDSTLRDVRHANNAKKAEESRRRREQLKKEKTERVAAREVAALVRDRRIAESLRMGKSKTAIVKELRVGWDTVSRVAKSISGES